MLCVIPRKNAWWLHSHHCGCTLLYGLKSENEIRSVESDFVTPWAIQSRPESWSGQLFSGQAFPSPEDLPNPGIKPRSSALRLDSQPAEPPRNPRSARMGSLSLLQQIFLTQESNRGLLHYRQIVYQLSYLYSIFTSFYLSIPIFSHDNNYYGKYRNRLVVLGKSVAM